VDGLGQELFGLRDEAGEGVQPDARVAEPVGGALPGEAFGCFAEDFEAVLAGPRSRSESYGSACCKPRASAKAQIRLVGRSGCWAGLSILRSPVSVR
jgi:hypothetical protein